MHELHPHQVSSPSLPILQPPTLPHLQRSTSATGHPAPNPWQPPVPPIVLLPQPSATTSNTSSHLRHPLPSHHASALPPAKSGSASNQPEHTCPAGDATYAPTLGLPHRFPSSSSPGASPWSGPPTCPPSASPRSVERRP